MSRTARASVGGVCYHVINRGNAKAQVYHSSADYQAFLGFIHRASERIPMRVLAYCLMPNHFHLVLRPHADGELSRWMHWLLTAHVKRHHRVYGSTGRIWQGRFKAFPIEEDRHLIVVLRYVERNPVRANLVGNAADWDWSSISDRNRAIARQIQSESPVAKPRNWLDFVNRPQTEDEVAALRRCSQKSTPYGSTAWVLKTAIELDLTASLRGPGRPKLTKTAKPGHS